jgi:hypothetical protein
MTCPTCGQPVTAGWSRTTWRGTRRYCSKGCAIMVDPTELEIERMEAAADKGGEYLDSLGKTDLATLSRDEWMTFIECVCTEFAVPF